MIAVNAKKPIDLMLFLIVFISVKGGIYNISLKILIFNIALFRMEYAGLEF
jgi:hypothetical protein